MSDSRRLPHDVPRGAVDRDDLIDALLEDGLDRYFNNRFEDAIHLWTRVLFLDRTHARARAYIDRARTALAEQQRRSEELLQTSRALLDQGQTEAARQALADAIAASGDDVQASLLRADLDRRERAGISAGGADRARQPRPPVPGWLWHRRAPAVVAISLGAFAVGVLATVLWLGRAVPGRAEPAGAPPAAAARLPVLSGSEVAFVRAQALAAKGRLSEALLRLDGVALDSPFRPAADRLRIEIQQLLLASVRSSSPTVPREVPRR